MYKWRDCNVELVVGKPAEMVNWWELALVWSWSHAVEHETHAVEHGTLQADPGMYKCWDCNVELVAEEPAKVVEDVQVGAPADSRFT
jgi:hypothetical protein